MSYYICPACGSSVDAGEHCSCGARDKPVLQMVTREEHTQIHANRPHTVIYDKFCSIQQELAHQQAIQAAASSRKRKGIYETICKKTESQ